MNLMIEQAQKKRGSVSHWICSVFALVAISAALPVSAAQGPLSGEQVRSLIVGNTVIGPVRGELYDFSYLSNGEVIGAAGGNTDGGTWRIRDGNVFCHEWSTFFGGFERCYQWYDKGNGRFTLKSVDAFKLIDLDVWRVEPGI